MGRSWTGRTRSTPQLPSRWPRWSAFAALVALVLATGCSVERTGVTGVGVDESGALVGYVQMCSDRIDGATLYATNGDALGDWNAPGIVTGFAKWSLADPGAWTATQPYTEPTGSGEYNFYGLTKDHSTSSTDVTFTLADLDGLKPGEVLYGEGPRLERVSEANFRLHACDDF